jgi:hypothetical protein
MNERIKKLWDQANIRHTNDFALSGKPREQWRSIPDIFAELIVRECAEQIKTHGISASSEDYGDYEIGFNAGLFHALRTTKEHFGVEE